MQNGKRTSVTEERYFNPVMLLLLDRGTVNCTDVQKIVKGEPIRKRLISGMRDVGLVSLEIIPKPVRTYKVRLTSLGVSVATDIKRAMCKISGDFGEDDDFVVSSPAVRDQMKG